MRTLKLLIIGTVCTLGMAISVHAADQLRTQDRLRTQDQLRLQDKTGTSSTATVTSTVPTRDRTRLYQTDPQHDQTPDRDRLRKQTSR